MNSDRRKYLADTLEKLRTVRNHFVGDPRILKLGCPEGLAEYVRNPCEDLTQIAADEQEAYDNLSEGFQQAERGQEMETAAQQLDDVAKAAESMATTFESFLKGLDDVIAETEKAVNEL